MKKLILLLLLAAFSSSSYAFDVGDIVPDNVTGQVKEHDNLKLEQIKEKNSDLAANVKEATGEKEVTIQKLTVKKDLKLKQIKAKNSVVCGNLYRTDGKSKGGTYQSISAKNATYTQSGGSDNIMGGNCILKKR